MIVLTGGSGFLGTAVRRELQAQGLEYGCVDGRRSVFDLRVSGIAIRHAILDEDVDTVIHLAYPGTDGIETMLSHPATLVRDQLQIDLHVIDACVARPERLPRLLCVGSVCSYPEQVTYPTGEDQFWSGYPEAVNAPFGVAKRMQLELLRACRRQYGLQGNHLVLGNLYGPGDRSAHVIPATIRKVLSAQTTGMPTITVWGDGTATREFLYVEDAARAIVLAALAPDLGPDPLNIVSGEEVPIRRMVREVCEICAYDGTVQWDTTKPNGQPRRWFDGTRARTLLGWTPQVNFHTGIQRTVEAWRCGGAA